MRNHDLRTQSTALIRGLRDGDEAAAQAVVDEYMPLLIRVARHALLGAQREASDEEDVVQSALGSFFRASKSGRFPELANRSEIKRLLRTMTRRKAINLLRRQNAIKHGGGRTRNESVLRSDRDGHAALDTIESVQATPDVQADMQESFQVLLDQLGDPELTQIALAKLDGLENREIARQLDCSLRTIERRVQLIRKIWCLQTKEA